MLFSIHLETTWSRVIERSQRIGWAASQGRHLSPAAAKCGRTGVAPGSVRRAATLPLGMVEFAGAVLVVEIFYNTYSAS